MKIFLPFIILAILFTACFKKKPVTDLVQEKQNMMQADRDFSKMSLDKGTKEAFLEYIDSNGVLLRQNSKPIFGGEAIYYITDNYNDSTKSMTWDPQGGSISASGDMGFTYGIFSSKVKTDTAVQYGTYVTIWKKQADGKWKFVLDSGNEGVGEIEQ